MADELGALRRRPAPRLAGKVSVPDVEITLCSCGTGGTADTAGVVHPLTSVWHDAVCTECGRTRDDIETDTTYLLMFPGRPE